MAIATPGAMRDCGEAVAWSESSESSVIDRSPAGFGNYLTETCGTVRTFLCSRPSDADFARQAFEEDDEGMTWEEFLPDYLESLRTAREVMAHPERCQPLENVFKLRES